MTRCFNNRLGLWVREDVVKDVFGPLKHHCSSFGVVFADTDKEGLYSHLGKHRLLLRRIHMCAIFVKRVAELEVQNSCLSHGLMGLNSYQGLFSQLQEPSPAFCHVDVQSLHFFLRHWLCCKCLTSASRKHQLSGFLHVLHLEACRGVVVVPSERRGAAISPYKCFYFS